MTRLKIIASARRLFLYLKLVCPTKKHYIFFNQFRTPRPAALPVEQQAVIR